jgi:hypothetical protein
MSEHYCSGGNASAYRFAQAFSRGLTAVSGASGLSALGMSGALSDSIL